MHYSPDVTDYIQAQPSEVAERLEQIRQLFHKLIPDTQESIRYGIPSFTVGSEHLYMSAYAHHIGLYPMYGLPKLESKLAPYRGRGTKDALHFKHDTAIPYALIEEIILAKKKD